MKLLKLGKTRYNSVKETVKSPAESTQTANVVFVFFSRGAIGGKLAKKTSTVRFDSVLFFLSIMEKDQPIPADWTIFNRNSSLPVILLDIYVTFHCWFHCDYKH